MNLFVKIEGATVILRSNGVYRQASVYAYKGRLFAQWSNGFVLLFKEMHGERPTSNPKVSWESLENVDFTEKHGTPVLYVKD